MTSISYSVEYAKSGRSTCKGSKQKIPKDSIRIAKITPSNFGEDQYMSSWYMVDAFFEMQYRMRKDSKKVESEDDLPGFEDLKPEDQDMLRQKIADFMNPDIKPPPKKRAAPKVKVDGEGAAADGGEGAAAEVESPKKKAKKEAKTFDSEVVPWYDAKARMIAADVYKKGKDAGIRLGDSPQAMLPEIGGVLMSLRNVAEKTIDLGAVLTELAKRFGVNDKQTEVGNEANRGLVDAFAEMSSHEFKNKDTFKALAYKKVSDALAKLTAPVTSGKALATGKSKLEGVGKASGQKIDEFLETGKIQKLEEYRASS